MTIYVDIYWTQNVFQISMTSIFGELWLMSKSWRQQDTFNLLLVCFEKCVSIIPFELPLMKNHKSPNAEIVDFGIVDISEDNDIHVEYHFWNSSFIHFWHKSVDVTENECSVLEKNMFRTRKNITQFDDTDIKSTNKFIPSSLVCFSLGGPEATSNNLSRIGYACHRSEAFAENMVIPRVFRCQWMTEICLYKPACGHKLLHLDPVISSI